MREFLTAAAIVAIGVVVCVLLMMALSIRPVHADDLRFCHSIVRDSNGRIHRSSAAIAAFRREHPCPSTGRITGPCKGWAIDHVIPQVSCGCDMPHNMQWLPNSIKSCARPDCKDRFERRVYTCPQVSLSPLGSAP